MLETPVVLLAFRRPDLTRRVLDAVAAARPRQLLIVCDGPREGNPDDERLVGETRAILEKLDWTCEVSRHYSDQNLGCGACIAGGLDWAFEQVEEAIILEDDCLPHPSFFRFSAELLERYRNDERIMAICGTNFFSDRSWSDDSYYFSKYFLCWGWATWRSAWSNYDRSMSDYAAFRSGVLPGLCDSTAEFEYRSREFDLTANGQIDTWDYQAVYSFWRSNGICIQPRRNLVSNIGMRGDGTHVFDADAWNAELPTFDIGTIRHPSEVVRNEAADRFITENAYLHPPRKRASWLDRVRSSLGRLF